MPALATASFPALGTTAVVVVTNPAALIEAQALLASDLAALDLACSRFRPDSELSRVNARAGEHNAVSPLLATATRVALDAAKQSDGLIDPALGTQLRAAGYDRTFALVRARDTWEFARVPERVSSWREIELDEKNLTLRIPPGVELDFGATAKAWAADRGAARIAANIGTGVLVSLGGDVAVAGLAPLGGWPVQIAANHAAPLGSHGPVVLISSGGIATSATAVRRWRTAQGEAHHILDPRTGRSAKTPWSHVTVAATSCTDANVASTEAIILGEAALDRLAALALPARAVRHDGSVAVVGDWPADALAA